MTPLVRVLVPDLISTKLSVPVRIDRLVPRARLTDELSRPAARLVLLSAPAGFGKSTLLREWLARSGIRGSWLSLDQGDNDLSRFLRYLHTAAARLAGDDGTEAAALVPDLALPVLVELLGAIEGESVVILDDYHLITNPAVHAIVTELIERLPSNARIAIATRADPPLPLARLRARGELVEVRADGLRFSEDEAADLLSLQLDAPLAAEAVATLAARTEGWAAVLQLAAVSLRGRGDVDRLVGEFGASHRFVLDFVTDEVLAGLDPDVREFLLATSILERMCGSLCDRVTGRHDGNDTLAALERANVLVIPLDDSREWYRFHHLFRDVLRSRLAASRPQDVPELHRRAAAWFESAGFVDDAVGHAFLAADTETARRLVRRHWLGWLHSGETYTVQRWLDAFPPDVLERDAQLCAVYGWDLVLRGESRGVADWIERGTAALGTPDADPQDRLLVPSQLACLRCNLASLQGDPGAALAHARDALALVPPADAGVPARVRDLLEGDATLLVAHGLVAVGERDAAIEMYRRALPLLHRGGNVIAGSHAVRSMARLEIASGRPEAAFDLATEALRERWNPAAAFDAIDPETAAAIPPSDEPPAFAAIHLALAESLVALDRLPEARAELARSIELGRRGEGRCLLEVPRVQALLDAAERSTAAGPWIGRRHPGLVEPLTARELEVLHLVAAGRSNREIADELFVAVGTVKAHLHTICGKLGAENRVQAINRAREEHLLA